MTREQLDQLCINTIRTLSMDAVQQANSGHPGTPMALAPVAYCLWQRFLRFDPQDMTTFWASAPLKVLQKEFGFTNERIVEAAMQQLGQAG